MNIPKWLLILLGVIVAGAVGVAAVLIGMRFAPPPAASEHSGPPTMTVPLLAPVADSSSVLGDEGETASPAPDATDDAGDGDADGDPGIPISDTVGEREVVEPDLDPDPIDPETLHLIDLVGLAPGLLPDLGLLGLGDREDDPCAPSDGSAPPSDCPAGAPATVLFDGDMPPLWLTANAFPAFGTDRDGIPDRDLSPLLCDPPDGGTGAAGLRIRVTAPGTWTVRFWPVDDPSDVQSLSPFVATDAQADRWASEFEPGGYPIIEHCGLFTGLEPDTVYTAVVSGVDRLDREPGAATITFNSEGLPVHPGIRVRPIGDNLLVASVLHTSDEIVRVQANVIDADAEPTCDLPADRSLLAQLTTVEDVAVGLEERLAVRAPDEFDEKDVISYRVPEGATVLLCARWFPDEGAPTWESDLSTFDSTVIVQSPDHLIPQVDLVGFTPRDSRSTFVEMHVSSTEGADCGVDNYQSNAGQSLPLTLCHPFFLSDGTAGTDDGRLYDRGFPSDLVISIESEIVSTGETAETTALLPAGAGACVGACTSPDPTIFTLATIGGAADIQVSWDQGLRNGQRDWSVSAVLDTPHDTPRHDAPRIDTRVPFTIQYFGFSHPYAAARMTLPVDREVDYTLTFWDNSTREVGVSCDDGSPLVTTGHGVSSLSLDMNGVCFGSQYDAELVLTDLDGNVAHWNVASAFDTYWRSGHLVEVPGLPVTVRYEVLLQTSTGRYLNEWKLTFNGFERHLIGGGLRDGHCSDDGIWQASGSFDANLRTLSYVALDIETDRRSGSFDCGSARTGDPDVDQLLGRPVWEELISPTGIEIGGAGDGARVRLYITPR